MGRFEPDIFADVVSGSMELLPCSPDLDEVTGAGPAIGIRGPERVRYQVPIQHGSLQSKVPVCLAVRMPMAKAFDYPFIETSVSIVVTDRNTGQVQANGLAPEGPVEPGPMVDRDDPGIQGQDMEWYYNVDLAVQFDLSGAPTTYVVYAVFEEQRSNVIEIELVEGE